MDSASLILIFGLSGYFLLLGVNIINMFFYIRTIKKINLLLRQNTNVSYEQQMPPVPQPQPNYQYQQPQPVMAKMTLIQPQPVVPNYSQPYPQYSQPIKPKSNKQDFAARVREMNEAKARKRFEAQMEMQRQAQMQQGGQSQQ